MARGIRTNPTLLPAVSQGVQPQSLASYDPKTRRNTILIAEIVPTVHEGSGQTTNYAPADRYYANIGPMMAASNLLSWWSGTLNLTFQNWDATERQFYARMSTDVSAPGHIGGGQNPWIIYPLGAFGAATSYAPKNASVAAVFMRFKARFNAAADYTVYGVGGSNLNTKFDSGHFFQVTRNAGNWELGSSDGSTISQTASAGGADGSFHEFSVRWELGVSLQLYVDGILTVTKTTDLPARPLAPIVYAENSTTTVDFIDLLVEWEAV